jgi:HAD superfamily hydrolase (TIGR01549 family)
MDNFLRRAGFAESHVEAAVQRYERSFADEYPVGLFDGVPAMLQQLARDQEVRLAVVSSNTSKNVRACLAQHSEAPLTDCFEFIWGIDNAARSKAESLVQAAAELGLAPQQIVYVGDTEKDARCAQACGMHFIGADWGGFEDMGQLASVAASAGGVEGLAPFVALQSPSTVAAEASRLIQSSPKPTRPRSSHSAEQGHTQPEPGTSSPYDAAGWWDILWFSWMTPLYDKKGEDLKLEVDAETAFANWQTPQRDAPGAHATKLQQAWNDGGNDARLLRAFRAIYGRWWLQIASLKLVGMVSVAGTPLLIKFFLGQLQLHTSSSVDTASAEDRWPFWVLIALVPTMTACSFLYTFTWHQ